MFFHIPRFDLETHPTWSLYLGGIFFLLIALLFVSKILLVDLQWIDLRPEETDIALQWESLDLPETVKSRMQESDERRRELLEEHRAKRESHPYQAISSLFVAITAVWKGSWPCVRELRRRMNKGLA